MNAQPRGLLAVWADIEPAMEAEFNAWYNREHIPERAGHPGFLNARRYAAIEGAPRYFAAYDTERLDTLGGEPYLHALANQSEWSRRVLPHLRNSTRLIAAQEGEWGGGVGGALLTLLLQPPAEALEPLRAALTGPVLEKLSRHPEVVRVSVGVGTVAPLGEDQAEGVRRAAKAPDALVVLVEAAEPATLQTIAAEELHGNALRDAGAKSPGRTALYRFVYGIIN